MEPGSGRQHMRHRGCYDQGRNVPSLNDSRSTASTGWRGGVGLPQQGQGLSTMTARAHCRHGPTIVGTRYLGRLRNHSSDATHLLNQRRTAYRCFAEKIWRRRVCGKVEWRRSGPAPIWARTLKERKTPGEGISRRFPIDQSDVAATGERRISSSPRCPSRVE